MKKKSFYENVLFKEDDRCAIITECNDCISHRELHNRAIQGAEKLRSNKFNFAIIYMENEVNFIIYVLSCWSIDIVPVFVRADFILKDIYKIYNNLSQAIIISDFANIDNGYNYIIVDKDSRVLCENYMNIDENVECHEIYDDLAILFPTSGSTNKAKYANVTLENVKESIKYINDIVHLNDSFVDLVLASVVSVKFFSMVLPMLAYNGKLLLYTDCNDIKKLAKIDEKYNITYMGVTPSFLKAILMYEPAVTRLKKVSTMMIGGEKSSAKFISEIRKIFEDTRVVSGYGLTETLIPINDFSREIPPDGSVGRLYKKIEIKILDENEKICESNVCGEIYLKGKNIISSYFDNNELNNISWESGWFKTGDIGYLDCENNLWITGRKKREIIVSGINVNAEEVENYLIDHELILASKVYGKDDLYTGERICADIVLKEDVALSYLDIVNYLKGKVSNYKIPKEIHFRNKDKIKYVGMGKAKFEGDNTNE